MAEIASIERCKKARQGSFFSQGNSTTIKSCSCGWHDRAVQRKKAKQGAEKGVPISATAATHLSSSVLQSTTAVAPLLDAATPLSSSVLHSTTAVAPLLDAAIPLSSGVLHSTTAVAPLLDLSSSVLRSTTAVAPLLDAATPLSSTHSTTAVAPLLDTAITLSSTHSTTAVTPLLDAATTLSSTHSITAVTPVSQLGSGLMPPKFNKSGMQSPTRAEIRSIRIGLKKSPGKLDLIVYCLLNGRCPYCKSALISINTVGKTKLCYGVPWPKSIVGVNMKCSQCKKHFMTHHSSYTDSLPLEEQIKQEFVTGKGNGSHISLLRLLGSGLAVVQVQRYSEDEERQHYHFLKSEFLDLWDKVIFLIC